MTGSSAGCRRDLDRRVRCQHVIGHQRGVAVRIGGCGMRTGADGDHMQHAGIGSDRAGLSDIMDCLVLICSAGVACSSAAQVCETGDKLDVERSMLSEIRDRSGMHHRLARATTVADLRCRSQDCPPISDGLTDPTLYLFSLFVNFSIWPSRLELSKIHIRLHSSHI
jgi:hypothetical protein